MDKVIFLRLGQGTLQTGFPDVEVRLKQSNHLMAQRSGSLPSSAKIASLLTNWQFLYQAFYEQFRYQVRGRIVDGIELEDSGTTSFSTREFKQVANDLINQMRSWLGSPGMSDVNNLIRTKLQDGEEIQIIIETPDLQIQQLPWHCWQFLEDYRKAEVSFSLPEFEHNPPQTRHRTPRVLVVLGNCEGIDTAEEEQLLQHLGLEVRLLAEPSLTELTNCLRDPGGWDIFFFAGHSSSQFEGQMCLNETEWVAIAQLKHALQKAIEQGLQLAIFNSCDGSRLARDLVDLDIPAVIVMKEPIPNRVAQEFLKSLLANFSQGLSLHCAVREARQSLEGMEPTFPCASWLPGIWQNPAATVPTWQELSGQNHSTLPEAPLQKTTAPKRLRLRSLFTVSLAVTGLVMGARSQGWLQPLELKAFDHLMQLRPIEGPDPRLLVVRLTQFDVDQQTRNQEPGKGSLSDKTLQTLIEKLEKHQPRVIGIDILRDQPVTPGYRASLGQRLTSNQKPPLIFICSLRARDEPNGVAQPPEVTIKQTGFNDVPQDLDQVTRLFFLTLSSQNLPCRASVSFGLQLALKYLELEGVTLTRTTEGLVKLDSTVFQRLGKHAGGYQNDPNVDSQYDQVLLNYRPYRRLLDIARSVPLQDVLSDRAPDDLIRNKIVLIGRTDTDLWSTPYPVWEITGGGTPGVYIHAQAVSQILSSVLDRRPLLRCLPLWADWLWVGGWAWVGALLVGLTEKYQPDNRTGLGIGLIGILSLLIYMSCWMGMLQAVWLPLIPVILTLVLSSLGVSIPLKATNRERD